MTEVCRSILGMRIAVEDLRRQGTVGLVTTMGALHDGHKALIRAACAEQDAVVATIFVNPAQFGEKSDLEAYPRNEKRDLALLQEAGAAAVFLPSVEEIYPLGEETIVETTRLANIMHGAVRPGHFRGVTTVVCKLFNIIGAHAAYFGEKDYQQLAVIRQMVRDLHIPIKIRGVPTVREPDGLAMSSRNVRLSPADRAAAPVVYKSLQLAAAVLRDGLTIDEAEAAFQSVLAGEPRARPVALDFVDAQRFVPVSGTPRGKVGIMTSVRFGDVLLIDQIEVEVS